MNYDPKDLELAKALDLLALT